MTTATRPCGCPADSPDHLDPEPDWIGDTPIMHGERDSDPVRRSLCDDPPCLCGHPNFLHCPSRWGGDGAWGGDVYGLTVRTENR